MELFVNEWIASVAGFGVAASVATYLALAVSRRWDE